MLGRTRAMAEAADRRSELTAALLAKHTDECRDRYVEQRDVLKHIQETIDCNASAAVSAIAKSAEDRASSFRRMYGMMWSVVGMCLVILLGIIGFLVSHLPIFKALP